MFILVGLDKNTGSADLNIIIFLKDDSCREEDVLDDVCRSHKVLGKLMTEDNE